MGVAQREAAFEEQDEGVDDGRLADRTNESSSSSLASMVGSRIGGFGTEEEGEGEEGFGKVKSMLLADLWEGLARLQSENCSKKGERDPVADEDLELPRMTGEPTAPAQLLLDLLALLLIGLVDSKGEIKALKE